MASNEHPHCLASSADASDLFTDLNNLIFIFDPLAVMTDTGQATTRKVLRWAVRLSLYSYVSIHITGDDSVWADVMTPWTMPATMRRLVSILLLPSTFVHFEWPKTASISASHDRSSKHRPFIARESAELWRFPSGSSWIPDGDEDLQMRLCIADNGGAAGHRSTSATREVAPQEFEWSTMNEDVNLFVSSCAHCISTAGGGKVPRPFRPALFGTKPNKLVQFDYIELGPSRTGKKYVVMASVFREVSVNVQNF